MLIRRFNHAACAFLLVVSFIASPVLLAQQPPDAQPGPRSYHLVLLDLGPAWDPAKPPMQQPGIQEHVAYMQKLMRDQILVIGGPFVEGPKFTSAFYILDAKTSADARLLAESDPAVTNGLMKINEVRTFLLFATTWKPMEKPAEK
jgi:uncharacterized protein YciI